MTPAHSNKLVLVEITQQKSSTPLSGVRGGQRETQHIHHHPAVIGPPTAMMSVQPRGSGSTPHSQDRSMEGYGGVRTPNTPTLSNEEIPWVSRETEWETQTSPSTGNNAAAPSCSPLDQCQKKTTKTKGLIT